MDLDFTPEQRELDDAARKLLANLSPLSVARSYLEGEGDPQPLWTQLKEQGWYTVGVGDDPFGVPGLACLARAAGEHAAPTPLVDTAVGANLSARLLADDPAESLLGRIAAGEVTVALALLEPGAAWEPQDLADDSFEEDGDNYIVRATKWSVVHGATVDVLLVVGQWEGALTAGFVPATDEGVRISRHSGMDPSADLATVTFDDVAVPGGRVIQESTMTPIEDVLALGAVLSAAEALGAASRALDMAVVYSRDRTQFGRAIGSFQALQHLMAGAHVHREAAWSTILHAAAAMDEALDDRFESVSIAKSYAARASQDVVEAAIQVFGGIAFTWEHDVHLLQRRTLAANQRYGDATRHETRLAEGLGKTKTLRETTA